MIIESLLSQDFYKFTMMQAVLHNFPNTETEYEFKCRNDADLLPIKAQIEKEIEHLCDLQFTDDELCFLSRVPFLKSDFIDFLENFRLRKKHVTVSGEWGKLIIKISGSWLNSILFEVPILAIVNECYFSFYNDINILMPEACERLVEKIKLVKQHNHNYGVGAFKFADFGLRRRLSGAWQDKIVEILKRELPYNFIGTSNVALAKKHSVKYIGTMAHEWLMAGQSMPNIRLSESQKYMLETWIKEYRGDLGIALSDTLGFDAFLKDFDKFFAKLYDGCRHDSGKPDIWCRKLIEHYEMLGIDPRTKSAVFSDGLTFPDALKLCNEFSHKINVSFGIGTNLTNDADRKPLQIVIKMTKCNGNPVAKISDSPGKGMCKDDNYLTYLKRVFNIPK